MEVDFEKSVNPLREKAIKIACVGSSYGILTMCPETMEELMQMGKTHTEPAAASIWTSDGEKLDDIRYLFHVTGITNLYFLRTDQEKYAKKHGYQYLTGHLKAADLEKDNI